MGDAVSQNPATAGAKDANCGCAGEMHPDYAARLPLLEGLPAPSLLAPPPTEDQVARQAAWDAPFGEPHLPEVRASDAAVEGPHGPVPLRVYRPLTDAANRPALVWIHGGAWVFGDLEMPESDHVARRLAAWADAVVVAVDYRLALDGVHFPVPHDDCWAAYAWTRDHADELGIDPDRISVGGGSAGANLAAGVALRGRDAGTPPAQALLVYPPVHPGAIEASHELLAMIEGLPDALRYGADESLSINYLGGPIASAPAYAFPGIADDLSGYPPTYIENAEFDALRASGEAFAAALAHADVAVELVTACGLPHGYLNRHAGPGAQASCRRLAARLRGEAVEAS